MKIKNRNTFWIYLILIFNFQTFGQCFDFTTSASRINNKPFIDIEKISKIKNSDNQLLLCIDTTKLYPDSVRFTTNTFNNFGLLEIDSVGFIQTYLKDLTTGKLYYIGAKKTYGNSYFDFLKSIMLKNCFIQTCFNASKKHETIIFNFKTLQISKSKFSLYNERIGYDDTAVYLLPPDFKYNKKKYKKGTIVGQNENGVYIINPVFENTNEEDKNEYDFFNNSYNVKANFKYTIEKNCSSASYYKTEIKYLNEVIDTFEIEGGFNWHYNFKYLNDTLTVYFNKYDSSNYYNSYRKYYKNKLIIEWIEEDFKKNHNLKNEEYSYLNFENYTLIKLVCDTSQKKYLLEKPDGIYTKNNIPLLTSANTYEIILMYDKQNNAFLGYPKIEFTTK